MTIIFFDAEEQKRQPDTRRISCVSWYDEDLEEMHSVEDYEIDIFVTEADLAELLVGFNVFAYDFKLFENTQYPVTEARDKTLDFFKFLRDRVHDENLRLAGGLGLDALGKVNIGKGKIPLIAPPSELWENGEHEIVIKYNQQDVYLLRQLFWKAMTEEELLVSENEKDFEEGEGIPLDCSELSGLVEYLQDNFYNNLVGW
ncbi:MAG: hypothetical protein PVF58_14300 [Candidatus Methanofastidiosia archaeon]|jgi:hypothetical protein